MPGIRLPGHTVDRVRELIVEAMSAPTSDERRDAAMLLVGVMSNHVTSAEIDALFAKPDFRAAESMISALESQR